MATPDDIREAAREYIAVIEDSAFSAEERLQRLRRSLDRLALLQHDVSYTFDERDYPDTPRKDYNAVRERVSSRFPDLGYYNVPSAVTQHIAECAIDVGDAVDDVADIAIELMMFSGASTTRAWTTLSGILSSVTPHTGSIIFESSSCACSTLSLAMKMRSNHAMERTTDRPASTFR